MNRYRILHRAAALAFPGSGLLVRALRKVLLAKPKPGMVITTYHGYTMEIDPVNDAGFEPQLYYHGTYETGTLQLLERLLPEGGTFIDAGANIGLMTLHAAQVVGATGEIHAFEPHPRTYGMLSRNVERNGFTCVTAHPLALGASAGQATLYDRDNVGRGGSTLHDPGEGKTGMTVEIAVLDAVFSGAADVLKVDVEGHEIEMLEGARSLLSSPSPPAVIVECSAGTSGQREALIDFFAALPVYKAFRHTTWKGTTDPLRPISGRDDLPEHDNIVFLTEPQQARLGTLILD